MLQSTTHLHEVFFQESNDNKLKWKHHQHINNKGSNMIRETKKENPYL
jgi:hypothetical protein